jgi:hypothetical protein
MTVGLTTQRTGNSLERTDGAARIRANMRCAREVTLRSPIGR